MKRSSILIALIALVALGSYAVFAQYQQQPQPPQQYQQAQPQAQPQPPYQQPPRGGMMDSAGMMQGGMGQGMGRGMGRGMSAGMMQGGMQPGMMMGQGAGCPGCTAACGALMHPSVTATSDGGVVVAVAGKLIKYNASLQKVAETDIDVDWSQVHRKVQQIMQSCPMMQGNPGRPPAAQPQAPTGAAPGPGQS